MFARYAYPPNELGYCGTGDGRELLEYASAASAPDSAVRPGGSTVVARSARGFDGAWPYLDYLAAAAGADSALDVRVVEAYWIGNELLDAVDPTSFIGAARTAFAGQLGADWRALAPGMLARPVPNHCFHVFTVYPWVGVLRRTGAHQALEVLERCRIRWGRVKSLEEDMVTVLSRPLTWDGAAIGLGEPRPERARLAAAGRSLTPVVRPGDLVALHWDWVCDTLSDRQYEQLRQVTRRQLQLTNRT